MEKTITQQWKFKLRGRTLKYGRLRQDGTIGWATPWDIGVSSGWPMGPFIPLSTHVLNSVNKTPTRAKSFATLRGPIRRSLIEVAVLYGCGSERKRKRWDYVRFLLDGKPFADFVILNFQRHDKQEFLKEPDKTGKQKRDLRKLSSKLRERRPKFADLERLSKAMFRFAVVVLADGLVWLCPGKTRDDG